jgi:acyl transferase domain-containing protein/acyl carrier protein
MTLNPQDELFERARRTIRELREKLRAAEAANRVEPIAVIGMGIRFPGCGSDLQQFWRMIVEGRDAVRSIPPERWDRDAYYAPEAGIPGKINTRHAAFLDDVRRFDAPFFDITPREAIHMDPQQRIFLETAWHALEDAGLPKARLAGSDTGVFVGVHSYSVDYQTMQFEDLTAVDAYSATGTAHDMIGARLAYWLDLHGPAAAVNTACSSSLLAAHLACQSLRAGDCSVAIAGGINLLLTRGSTVAAAQLQLLSPDGRCKTFDARADGMGRGEGCGIVVLKKLDAVLRDGDRVLAVIRGSAVNQDGKTNGLTAPNGISQRRVLARALNNAGVEPREIGYVEAHGTGTALGDPIEVEALAEVLGAGVSGEGTRRETPCTLGAVKANIGHLEGAAGIAGLIKAVLVLRNRWLPPVANLKQLNPHLAIDGTRLSIPHQGRAWVAERRLAGVSSFGWSGTNVHVVLEEAAGSDTAVAPGEILPLVISAQSPAALRVLAAAYADRLEHAEESEVVNICYTSAVRRTHHAYRIAVKGTRAKRISSELRRRIAEWPGAQSFEHRVSTESGSRDLDQTMRAWETGADVDWSFAFANRGSVVDLPQYPFQGAQYWLSTANSAECRVADTLPVDWLYSIEWREKPLSVPLPDPAAKLVWLLIHGGEDLGKRLAEVGRQRGDKVVEVLRGRDFSSQTMDTDVSGESFAERLKHLFAELAKSGIRLEHAVYVAGDQSATEAVAEALELAQAVIQSGIPLKLWFVTQSFHSNGDDGAAFRLSREAIRGFSRVLGLEHPEHSGGVIEVDADSMAYACAIRDEMMHATGEDRVSLRESRRWVARLRRDSLLSSPARLELKADRSYLVTGAFGRLGMEIASWLVLNGARHLVLVGRRDPLEIGNSDLIRQLEDWKKQGVTLTAEACDVSDELQVRELLTRMNESGRSLAGLIHAAAGVRFGAIANASRQDVELAFRAKVDGARVLDRCIRSSELDFFVLFGSAAATIGLRNGSLYAAANGCLDSIAANRQKLGLPALCVEWGSWESPGDDEQLELVERSGFVAMNSHKALGLLGALIVSRRASGLVADIDWRVLGPALETRGRQALVESLVAADISDPEPITVRADALWLDEVRELPVRDRKHRLLDFVGGEVRKVFGMASDDPLDEGRGLFQSGMDSLMSVKLKRALEAGTGLRLPGTLTFTYPTIEAIAAYLEERLFPLPVAEAGSETLSPRSEEEDFSASVAEMSESETNAAIAAELAAIQQKLGAF